MAHTNAPPRLSTLMLPVDVPLQCAGKACGNEQARAVLRSAGVVVGWRFLAIRVASEHLALGTIHRQNISATVWADSSGPSAVIFKFHLAQQ